MLEFEVCFRAFASTTATEPCQVSFLLSAVAYDYDLFKHLFVRLQLDRFKDGTVAHGYFAFFVSDVAYHQDGIAGNIQLEVTVQVGDGSALSAFDGDIGSD